MENAECGAVCLSIILAYYKKFIPLEELREQSGVSRDGSNALYIIDAAKKYQLHAEGKRLGLKDLYHLKKPTILFWNYNHFVVLEGFAKDRVYLNDPAFGPRTITYEELDEFYTGVALIFEKAPDFKKSGRPQSIIKDLKNCLKGVHGALLYIIFAGFLLLVPGLAIPVFTRIFVDNILVTNILTWKNEFFFAMFLATLLGVFLTALQQYFLNRLRLRLSISLSSKFLWHILRLPMSFYSQRFPAEIANRVGQNNTVSSMLTGTLATVTIQMMLIVFYGAALFVYDVAIGIVGVILALSSFFIMAGIQRSRTDTYARLQKEQSIYLANALGVIQQIETIKATGIEKDAFETFTGYDSNKINSLQSISRKDSLLTTAPIFFQALATAILFGIGGLRTINGSLTFGTLIALQMLLISFLAPVTQFLNVGQLIQFLKIELLRLNDVLKNSLDDLYTKKNNQKTKKVKLEGYVEFRNVTFGYNPMAPPLIENFNLKIKPGERIALVGPSGCGKSTLSKLSTGLIKPWDGEVLYDGKPYLCQPREVLQRSLACIDQEIFLFSGSIRDNLTLWDNTVKDDVLINSAIDACIHDDILLRKSGYDTELSEGGRNLSGGQRQRLEIARALIPSPTILILDEATSALDSNTEKTVMNNIRQRGCSAIMVAHRLSTIQDCEEIIVLNAGAVVDRGSHKELKDKKGIYRTMILSETNDA